MRQDAQTLLEIPFFRGVPPAAIVALTHRAVIESYDTDMTVFRQGDTSDRALLLISGRLEVTLGDGPARKRVGDVRPGEVFGETALFAPGQRRSASVFALEPSRALVISQELIATKNEGCVQQGLENDEDAVVGGETVQQALDSCPEEHRLAL